MTERSRNIAVGLTAIVGLTALAFMLSLFGYMPALVAPGWMLSVHMPNAAGLGNGSRAKLNGIEVGSITGVELDGSPRGGVLARVRMSPKVSLPKAVSARVEDSLLGGAASIALSLDGLSDEQKQDMLPRDGTALIEGQTGSLAGSFRQSVRGIEDRFANLTARFESLSKEWEKVGQNLNQVIEPREPGEVDSGTKAGNLATVLARSDQRLAEMKALLDGLRQWVDDEQLKQHVRGAMANADRAAAGFAESSQRLNELADNAGRNIKTLTDKYAAVADELTATVTSARKLLDLAAQGDGTAGRLMKDPALYDNLNDAAQRLGQAVGEVKQLIEKVRKEGLPLQY